MDRLSGRGIAVSSLVGREAEEAEITRLVDQARQGVSGVLIVRGEAGIGKSSLLEAATSSAAGFDVVRLVGIESEMRLGFAALHLLMTPFFDRIEALPRPQARALQAALGMSDDAAPDRYLVGLAALTLLTTIAAARGPLLIVVDDAQWLDQESADVLGFVGRRLRADSVCVLVAVREPAEMGLAFDRLPSTNLGPLSEAASMSLFDGAVQGPVADTVRTRVLAEASGNPLALVEFGRGLSPDQLSGAIPLPEMLAVNRRLEQRFSRQVNALSSASRTLLLVAAAEPTSNADLVWRAGRDLGFDDTALAAAQAAGLLSPGTELAFRHPLIRSAVYQGADPAQRRRAHTALAAVCDPERQLETRAWHRAAAAQLPDEDIAAELERASALAASRGSAAAAASLLARSADLTPDPDRRAVRLLSAATADMTSGSVARARAHLARSIPDLPDPILVARAQQLDGMIEFLASDGSAGDSVSKMVGASRALAPLDVRLARDVMLDAIVMARIVGDESPMSVTEVARLARSLELPEGTQPTTADLVLDATAELLAEGLKSAAPLVRRALNAVRTDSEFRQVPRNLSRACYLPLAVSDYEALLDIATACAETCRELGDFRVLSEALYYQALQALSVGALDTADDILTEEREVQAVLQRESRPCEALELIVASWRGHEPEVRLAATDLAARSPGLGVVITHIAHARAVLELSLGNYQPAAELVPHDWTRDLSPLGALRAADAVEALLRNNDRRGAEDALQYLDERAGASESHLDLGLLTRCKALLADDTRAEAHFRDSIADLEICGANLHVARSRLLFGEWLRRKKRRRDAREQLESAWTLFDAAGAVAFAERARVELLATGGQARRRVDATRDDLTPQERQIARMAAGGATNQDIAARLFISANTVDYHLRKVYRKLQIKSRHELGGVLADT